MVVILPGLTLALGLLARDTWASGVLMFVACLLVAVGWVLAAVAGAAYGYVSAVVQREQREQERAGQRRPRRPVAEA